MKKMKLPISDKFAESDKWLTMDEYIEFVNFNHRYFRKHKIAKKDVIEMCVNVPFSLI